MRIESMMASAVAAAGAVALASGGAAQVAATTTVQQDFEAATALSDKGDNGAALAAWDRLEGRTKAGGRSNAIVLVRKSATLFALGRMDEAVAAARRGLAALPQADTTLAEDRTRAFLILGRVATDTLDYPGAIAAYTQAEAGAIALSDKLGALLGLAEVQTFVDPAGATRTLDTSDALLAKGKPDKATLAAFARRRTLLLLNGGDIKGGRTSAIKAVNLLGGLTSDTSTADAAARSDAAIALLLDGNRDEARRYMAMTGAGRLTKGSFDPAAGMKSPDCGGEADLKPQDMAIVEFSIAPDGTVAMARPIYAAGGGKVALEYARAARDWSWPAESVKSIPPFFRYNVRVEMRCSTTFERPSIVSGLDVALEEWLATKGAGLAPEPSGPATTIAAGLRRDLAAAEAASPTSLRTLGALYRLSDNAAVPREERAALLSRAVTIATANDAPANARLALDLPARTSAVIDPWKPDVYGRMITPLLAEPVYARDPQARAAIRILLADERGMGRRSREADSAAALALLQQVSDDAALAKNDPLRVGALVRIASIQQNKGAIDAARAAFASSGLNPNQCAIMDAAPKMLSMPGSEAFPQEAILWGFEGWTQVQFDVGADGRVVNERPLLSYPPFIFSKAGTDVFRKATFSKSYRPDGGLGCGATTRRLLFSLPK